jgi:hypothetical protein
MIKIRIMEKENIRDRMKKSIDELFDAINRLDSRKDELKDKSKAKFDEILSEIKDWESKFEAKHRQSHEGGDKSWDEAKQAFGRSAHAFREAVENLASFLRNTPPPSDNFKGQGI